MEALSLLAELIRDAEEKSECVALFVLSIVLIVVMHMQNIRRFDDLRRRQEQHEKVCNREDY